MHRPKGSKEHGARLLSGVPSDRQEAMAQSETQAAPSKTSGVSSEMNISDFNLFISVSVRFQTCEGRDIKQI